MSFTGNKNEDIIEVKGNVITVKDTRKISKKDMKFLSEKIAGWTYCDRYSSSRTCETKNRTFPSTAVERAEVEKVIAKYQ